MTKTFSVLQALSYYGVEIPENKKEYILEVFKNDIERAYLQGAMDKLHSAAGVTPQYKSSLDYFDELYKP